MRSPRTARHMTGTLPCPDDKHEKSAGHRLMGAGAPRLFGLLNPAAGFKAARADTASMGMNRQLQDPLLDLLEFNGRNIRLIEDWPKWDILMGAIFVKAYVP